MAKYELVKSDFLVVETPRGRVKVYRIRALNAFGNVKKGELGGYVQKPTNLDQNGNAWVSGDAQVFGGAQVCGGAQITRPILQLSGCEFTANENGQGIIRFGCLDDTIEGWLASCEAIGKEHGYSPTEIAICKMFIDQVALMQKEYPLPTKEC